MGRSYAERLYTKTFSGHGQNDKIERGRAMLLPLAPDKAVDVRRTSLTRACCPRCVLFGARAPKRGVQLNFKEHGPHNKTKMEEKKTPTRIERTAAAFAGGAERQLGVATEIISVKEISTSFLDVHVYTGMHARRVRERVDARTIHMFMRAIYIYACTAYTRAYPHTVHVSEMATEHTSTDVLEIASIHLPSPPKRAAGSATRAISVRVVRRIVTPPPSPIPRHDAVRDAAASQAGVHSNAEKKLLDMRVEPGGKRRELQAGRARRQTETRRPTRAIDCHVAPSTPFSPSFCAPALRAIRAHRHGLALKYNHVAGRRARARAVAQDARGAVCRVHELLRGQMHQMVLRNAERHGVPRVNYRQ